eukprot:TRINITY_DN3867_c0_g1_i1.p1 TRINITY_DN3867_c0_g1~~TRINITY_DN3867_c0_g1_i1.p1  ORF type:complete len:393 (+),score=84.22 TRINITY_DN3867_c0_g1_i1:147-1181(+)
MAVTLNRPKALNSLTHEMVQILTPLYRQWETDDSVANIVVRGQGRAFCAGGDIVQIFESGKAGTSMCKDFFREEYILNHLIGTLQTPHVAIISGITMGGGVGLSVHGQFRVATDTTLFAMPETGIGFFPDVGGSYFLPRLEGSLGMYLGLTGQKLKGQHVAAAGIATHYIPNERIGDLENELSAITKKDVSAVEEVLNKFVVTPSWGDSDIKASMDLINKAFSQKSVEEIIEVLRGQPNNAFAQKTLETLNKMSPTSLKVSHKLLTLGKKLTFEECFELEYNVSQRFMKGTDFYEGVGELLVTKTNNPHWNPPTLAEVQDADIDLYFAHRHELRFGKNRIEAKL